MVDFYGFQDANGRSRQELEQAILAATGNLINNFDPRFVRPYVQMHEFEGLLFSAVEHFACVLDGWNDQVHKKLTGIRAQFGSPEDINNDRETAPSKRILAAFAPGTYSKTEHGPLIAEAIGLDEIRNQCPQFDEWMCWLEGLALRQAD